MQSGKLNRTVTFERLTETVSETGAVSATWAPLATVRAQVTDATLEEIEGGNGERPKARLTVVVRYLPGLTLADRLTYGGRAFNILSMAEIGRKRGLEFKAVAP